MKMKKIAALSLATVMTLGLSATAFAQTAAPTTPDADNATITIANASKGETYTIYQLFNATVTGNADGSIAYQLMEGKSAEDAGLLEYFDVDASGNVTAKESTNEAVLKSDEFKAWAASYGTPLVSDVESDGSALNFTGLPYGYYYVTTSQGTNITVDSTNPNATIYDKNSTTPKVDDEAKKTDKEEVTVGETVTYTVTFNATNFIGEGEDAQRVLSYTIKDTLPDWLSDVNVTSIIVDNDGDLTTTDDQANVTTQFVNKEIELAWVDGDNNSLYNNNALIQVVYTATVNAGVTVGSDNPNVNEVTIGYKLDNGQPSTEYKTVEETIETYALAIQKVDENGNKLPGATFTVKDIEYVISLNKDENGKDLGGHYKVALADTEGAMSGAELKSDANGYLILEGVKSGDYTVTEVTAPGGYNKLTTDVTVTAQKIKSVTYTYTTTVWKDAQGNITDTETEGATKIEEGTNQLESTALVVINQKGNELPSTGGIGTTIFYVVGGILVVGAGVVLVAKKRMNHEA